MTLEPYEFRNPGELLAEVMTKEPLRVGDALLVLVADPSLRQRVENVVRLRAPVASHGDHDVLSTLLRDAVRRMPIPPRPNSGMNHAVMTILTRRGRAVFGSPENQWFLGWRYSNHCADAFTGDITLVTEHGWTDFMTHRGGYTPRLTEH
jgi:hypothetical protein